MIYADTEGLLDRCHCGAVAGFEYGINCVRVVCSECHNATGWHYMKRTAIGYWNLARRAEKAKL